MKLITKRAIADAFRKLLEQRSIEKITVKDIVNECGLNRQTFYYHFYDIYDLMEWMINEARYDYEIEDTYEAGIVLTGTEIKSIRLGKVNIKDSYAIIRNNEIFLLNTHISIYDEGNRFNHEEDRTRKLLLHKKEILKLRDKLEKEGYTIIPLKIYFVKNKAKVLLGLAKGKKNYNKKETIKERDIQREMEKSFKYR